jgi:hypothetical protein
MNEEEARSKLRARLDGWQVYQGVRKPAEVEEPLPEDDLTQTGARALPLAVVAEEKSPSNHAASSQHIINGAVVGDAEDISGDAACIAPLTQECEHSRPLTEAMPAEQGIEVITFAGTPPNSPSEIEVRGKSDYPAPQRDHKPHKRTVFLAISVLTLAGFCVLFLSVLFGK